MSGFRDTFTKNESQEELLGYDDSAFLYFAVTVLTFIVVPWSYTLLTGVLFPEALVEAKHCPSHDRKGRKYKYCEVSTEVEKIKEQKREAAKSSNRFTNSFFIRAAILTALWSVNIHLIINASGVEEMKRFDPFDILNVAKEATEKEIKKAYRKLSLKWHPDKNPDNPMAQAQFIQIKKAYETLTDTTAMKVYEKYGNPDGPTGMKVGVGLPRFLVEQENKVLVLSIAFFMLLFLFPLMFIDFWQRQKAYAASGVLVESLQTLGYFINTNSRAKHCAELMAASGESRMIAETDGDKDHIAKLESLVTVPHPGRWKNIPLVHRNHYLVLAHMQRKHDEIPAPLKPLLQQFLRKTLKTTISMIEIAAMREWFSASHSMVSFRRSIVQALAEGVSPFWQIPGCTEAIIKNLKSKHPDCTTVPKFLNEEKAFWMGVGFSVAQCDDIEKLKKHFPMVDITASIGVEEEKEIVEGDIATVKVSLTRKNLADGEAMGPIYAPFLPEPVFEEWWFYVVDGDRIIAYERIYDTGKNVVQKIRFSVSRPGMHKVRVYCLSDCYASADVALDLTYKVHTEEEVNREIFIHPEDRDLDLMPTLFESFMGQMQEEDDSDAEQETDAAKKKDDDSSSSSSSSSSDSESDEE